MRKYKILGGYGLLALVGGWGLARLLPENASALLLFHLLLFQFLVLLPLLF